MNAVCAVRINEEPCVLISQESPAHVLAIRMPLQSPSGFFFLSTSIASAFLSVVREGCEAVFQHHFVPLRGPSHVNSSAPAMRLLTLMLGCDPELSAPRSSFSTVPDKSKLNQELSRTLSHARISWTLMELVIE